MKTKNIKQTVIFDTTPDVIYEMLIDSTKHAAFTESPAKLSRNPGEKFTAYGNYIEGQNISIIPNQKIVQKWRGKDWPVNHFSTVTFHVEPLGKGTKLTFTQLNVPLDQYEPISQGWREQYWQKMKAYLKKN